VIGTTIAFFGVGSVKSIVLGQRALRAGLETLLTGGAAAFLAYVVGTWLRLLSGPCSPRAEPLG
jgi:VIT1/CCC1 family predicted Fe2+/Mn2+ transporter